MKNLLKLDIKTIAIGVLIIIIILLRTCSGGGGGTDKKPTETVKIGGKKYEVIKRDTVVKEVPVIIQVPKKGKDIYHDTTIYVPVKSNIDTAQIIKEFFAKNVYNDTLKLDDSLGFVAIKDTISQNKILSRIYNGVVFKKSTKETVYLKEPPKRQMYLGVYGGADKVVFIKMIGIDLLYKDKKDKIYTIGVGVTNNGSTTLTPYIKAGLFFKIKL